MKIATLTFTLTVAIGMALAVAVSPVPAIDIILKNTQDFDGEEDPGWDEGGAILMAHATAAEAIWESLLPYSSNTYELWIEWDDDIGEDTLGLWTPHGDPTWNLIEINSSVGTKPDSRHWYADPTPHDHSEFNLSRTLYQSLLPQHQSAWFPGTAPPGPLEIGYQGVAPNDDIRANFDLLSVLLHEMGHELGVSWIEPGEYNVYPHHVGGLGNVLLKEDGPTFGHLADGAPWLMAPHTSPGTRTLPSAADVFAMAEDQGILEVHLHRVYSIGAGSWHNPARWLGGRVPDSTQHVLLEHGTGTVHLAADVEIATLRIRPPFGMSNPLRTLNHRLRVLQGPTIAEDDLIVDSGGEIILPGLQLVGADLILSGGNAEIGGALDTDEVSAIKGHGTVRTFDIVRNNYQIFAEGGTLRFQWGSFAPNTLDLDGTTEDGKVFATEGDLSFEAGLTDPFDGTMWVDIHRTATFTQGWVLGSGGILDLDTGAVTTQPATIAGGDSQLWGRVFVTGLGVFSSPPTFHAGAEVLTTSPTSRLRLDSFTTYDGGRFTGEGILDQRAWAEVTQSSQIATKTYNWDGSNEASPSRVFILPNQTLTIDSDVIEEPGNPPGDGYDGKTQLDGGILLVNTKRFDAALGQSVPDPWRLDSLAELRLNNSKILLELSEGDGSLVAGSPIHAGGRIYGGGEGNRITASVVLFPTAQVQTPNPDDQLSFDGLTEYRGGTFTGAGTIRQSGDAVYAADTTINVATYDWDGNQFGDSTLTIKPGVTLRIRSQHIEDASATDGFEAILNIDQGTAIVNPGYYVFPTINFHPWVLGQGGRINLLGSAILSGAANPAQIHLPGSPLMVLGDISATGVNNVIYSVATFGPSAQVHVNSASVLTLGGETSFAGGSYSGAGMLIQNGAAFVRESTVFDVATFDLDGSVAANFTTWTLERLSHGSQTSLTINAQQINAADNQFHGTLRANSNFVVTVNLEPQTQWQMNGLIDVAGASAAPVTLEVHGSPVRISGAVNVAPPSAIVFHSDVSGPGVFGGGGSVTFLGAYEPGSSPGIGLFETGLAFGPSATLNIEAQGLAPGQAYDQLVIGGKVTFDGTLHVELLRDFQPRLGDQFIVATYRDHSGAFAATDLPLLSLPGTYWAMDYGSNALTLTISTTIAGDITLDGMVDEADAALFVEFLGLRNGATWSTGDFNADGATTLADLSLLQANLGRIATSPSLSSAAIPEPSALTLVAIALTLVAVRLRRKTCS